MLIAMREIESDVERFKVAFNATGSVDADFFYFLADTSLMVF